MDPLPLARSQMHGNAGYALSKVEEICDEFSIVALHRQIDICQGLLSHDPLIDIAVLGQFKAGKSSFLNSLVGKAILPMGVIPVTTVITRLTYGPREKATVTHLDGTVAENDLTQVQGFTSEATNPANQKNVEVVDIELPSLKEHAGIRLVDTPGLGSVLKHHMETAENWLPEVGAALLAISADRPLSEDDLELIQELMQHTPKIVLLLTKADLLSPDQQAEVVEFFRKTLLRELDREFPVFLYSTRANTEQWKHRIEAELLARLSHNRDMEFKRIMHHKLRALLRSCSNYLEIALRTSMQADQDRDSLRSLILDERLSFDLMRDELIMISRENAGQTRSRIMKRLEEGGRPKLTQMLSAQLREEMPSWKGNLWKLTRRYEDWLSDSLIEEIGQLSKTERPHFLGTLKKAHASFSRSLELFRSLLDRNLEKALGIRLAEADWKIEVTEPSHPDVKMGRTFESQVDLLWFLIPMVIFRRLFEKHFMRQIPGEVEVNLSRLASQWADRINKVIEGMRKQAEKYVHNELATIEGLLSKAQGRTEEIGQAMEEIQKALNRLDA
jgi:GTP-binding protein EngB required for normal cell division